MSYRRNTRAYSCRRIPRIGYAGRRDGETTRPAQAARRRGLLLLGRDMRFQTRSRPTTWYSIICGNHRRRQVANGHGRVEHVTS